MNSYSAIYVVYGVEPQWDHKNNKGEWFSCPIRAEEFAHKVKRETDNYVWLITRRKIN